ncbi:S-layer homology domain-containing protein [Brevibacillus borstelensis]|uniref:S-layer homology domain-containing protein n=1 Tax=Brevibacillus borstelensis TaxID=45462 RepID=UPI0030C64CA8
MQQVWKIRQILITLMAVVLVLAGVLPGTVHQAYAIGGGGITLDGFSTGASGSDPYVHYEDRITISGTFVGVDGANLRISIRNNGVTEDLTTTKPIVEADISKFVFTNIPLKPGMNEMNFYELRSSGNRSLFTFYVVHNTTPAFSNLMINEVPFSNDPEVPTVAYYKRNTALTGKAANADTVRVNNKTTGETFTTEVNRSGSFALDLTLPIGLNVLEIQGLSNNKEVSLIEKEVLFTNPYTAPGSNDIFYNATLASTKLLNPAQATIVEADFGAVPFAIKGDMLIHRSSDVIPFAVKAVPGNSSDTTTTPAAGTVEILDKAGNRISSATVSRPTSSSQIRVIGQDGEFEQWSFTNSFAANSSYVNGDSYTIKVSYPYVENKYVDGAWQSTQDTVSVKYHVYPFKYMKNGLPQFLSATLSSEGNQKVLEGGTYSVRSTPFTIDIATKNITSASPYSEFSVAYSSPESISSSDYSVSRLNDSAGNPTNTYRIKISKPPARQTKVTISYTGGSGSESIAFNITPDAVPHLQLSYVSSNKTIYVENQLEIADLSSPPTLKGSVKNYSNLVKNKNISVELDGKSVPFTVDNSSEFTIKSSDLAAELKKNTESGIRVLEIKLTEYPNVKYKYNIKYTNKDIPKIEDIKMQIEQAGRDIDLKKKSTDATYNTNSLYLSKLSFKVNSNTADEITVRKDGKVIAVLKHDGSKWRFKLDDPEYTDSLRDAQGSGASSNRDLKKLFENTNFNKSDDSSSDTISANMDSDDYQDLLEELDGLSSEDLSKRLPLFPLVLKKGGSTTFEIAAAKGELVTREKITIMQTTNAWVVLDPIKPEDAKYITVNANSVPIKIFAENATKVSFGKLEAIASQTDTPKFEFSEKHGRPIPTNGYYVFEATVPLKAGLNTVKYTVEVGGNKYNDQIQIFNAASTVTGAEYRETLGKKTSFTLFDKALELKFPSGTVLLNPPDPREGNEVNDPNRDIHTDVTLYFGIADRTTGAIQPGEKGNSTMRSQIAPPSNFNYASPLYYIDAGDVEAVGGRDPYFDETVTIDGREVDMEPWWQRYQDNLVPSKQGTLTIKYDTSIVNAANTTLAIFYNDGSNKGWVNAGGVVNTGKKTVTVPFKGFGYYMVMKIRNSFPDVVRHEFARDAIETLYSKGIMNSYSNSTFGTEMKISRGEFATMIVKALDLPINASPYSDNNNRVPSEPTFTDVDRNDPYRHWDWSYEYIETAARAGIIRGKDARRFFPDDTLTREEAAIIISRALNLKTGTPEASKQALGKMFTDGDQTGHYAVASVLAVTKAKLMNGEPNDPTVKKPTYRFNPTGDLTRAEMAVITVRIMAHLKKLPK